MAKVRYDSIFAIVAIFLVIGFIAMVLAKPTFTDQFTTPGRVVKFAVPIVRDVLQNPRMDYSNIKVQDLGSSGNIFALLNTPYYVTGDNLDTMVKIRISKFVGTGDQTYTTIATNTWTSGAGGGSTMIFGTPTFIPTGTYKATFTSYVKGGLGCILGCPFIAQDTVCASLIINGGVTIGSQYQTNALACGGQVS